MHTCLRMETHISTVMFPTADELNMTTNYPCIAVPLDLNELRMTYIECMYRHRDVLYY